MTELIAYLPTVSPVLPYAGTITLSVDFAFRFDLADSICVTAVGAFDHNQDSFVNDITVSLWLKDAEANTGTLINGSDTTFTSSDAGDLDEEGGVFRWKSLEIPFELAVGTYLISASGFGDDDKKVEFIGAGSVQPGDEALDFTGNYQFGPYAESQPSLPTATASSGDYAFMTGNFKFLIGDYDVHDDGHCTTAQPVTPVNKKRNKNKNNKNRQNGKKGKRDGKKGKKD
jgi:hypothetical protein